jgi:hypothetical protein
VLPPLPPRALAGHQVLGAKVRLMALQVTLLELEVDAADAVGQLCQVGRRRRCALAQVAFAIQRGTAMGSRP